MRKKLFLLSTLLFILNFSLTALGQEVNGIAAESPVPVMDTKGINDAENVTKSTIDDQRNVEVTVYNNNLALVKDVRRIDLPSGRGELRFMDVAAQIMPVTVLIKSLNFPDDLAILEQNYEYDLMSPQKLMDKYVGKDIKIVDYNAYQDKKEVLDATLLSNNNGEIYRINNEIFLGHAGYKVLPEIPDNLIAQPTLTWLYSNTADKPQDVEVAYLTNSLTWRADYVLAVNGDDTLADLSGWVTLDNQSGATYKEAKLKLIAGEVNRVSQAPASRMLEAKAMRGMASEDSFAEKSFFEYHIYDLQRRTTIKDNQTKQVSLLEANGVKVQKEMQMRGNQYYFYSAYKGQNIKTPVEVFIKFKNAKDNNVGMPLPAGIVRLYKEDTDGSRQFIGEDSIQHTPKDEEVRLKIGEAFDVVAERVQTDFQILASNLYESVWEVTLRNHKEEAVTVGVIEPLTSDWQIIESSLPYTKVDAFTIRFDVTIPKDGEVKVKYRVRVKTS